MKRIGFLIVLAGIILQTGFSQKIENRGEMILFRGLVIDASTYLPIANSQIFINRAFASVSSKDGAFSFYVNRNDTIIFSNLGYKSAELFVSDTLSESEFIAGIYMNKDTMSIGEVVIIPRHVNLKYEILNAERKTPATFDNARYNVAISAYQGRNSQSSLGTPDVNYAILSHKQKIDAYERGGIPSDKIVGLSPFLLIPAAYLLVHGLPEKHTPMKSQLTEEDVHQIHKKYLETLRQKK